MAMAILFSGCASIVSKTNYPFSINANPSNAKISITDNGIGRTKSTELKNGEALKKQSYGMKVTSDRIALINQVYKSGASVIIDDLTDENHNPLGTKVIIQIPI